MRGFVLMVVVGGAGCASHHEPPPVPVETCIDQRHLDPGTLCVDRDPGTPSSEQRSGDVYVDGKYFGNATRTPFPLEPGLHDIGVLTKTDYRRVHIAVSPTLPTVIAPTAQDIVPGKVWKTLFLEVRTVDAEYTADEGRRTCKSTLSPERADVHFHKLEQARDRVREMSGGLVQWELERRVLEEPVRELDYDKWSEYSGWAGNGPSLGSEPLGMIGPFTQYDTIAVAWSLDGCVTPAEAEQFPLCYGMLAATGAFVTTDVTSVKEEKLCGSDDLVHEWLHTIEHWADLVDAPLPKKSEFENWPLHANVSYGYRDASDPFWEADFLMKRIEDVVDKRPGSLGFGPDLLSRCTTRSVFFENCR